MKIHYHDYSEYAIIAIFSRSDYFIGNCVSSFTAFIGRERIINNKPWGMSQALQRINIIITRTTYLSWQLLFSKTL